MQAIRKPGFRRAAITAATVTLLVVLGGCCVYPAGAYNDGGYGYGGHRHGGYGGYERYEWRDRGRHW